MRLNTRGQRKGNQNIQLSRSQEFRVVQVAGLIKVIRQDIINSKTAKVTVRK